ncbi:unnamed protein product [Rhodiola kirilowii]
MLDDLLGRGFASKVKSLMKVTKTRIEAVRKKRNATHRFLKKDIADLLTNGLDINAFGRAEGLVSELIISSCYDFVDHCCDCVLKNISALHKKRECPEECKVAMASLMFAAARFSDLPELRDLRQIFQGRYGNSLELYINQKFVKNLSAKPASMENKLQLMKDIAFQYSIMWNAAAFEQRMSKSLVSTPKEHLDYGSFHGADNRTHTASNHKMESGNCKNKADYTSLLGLFNRPNQDSKENAILRNDARNNDSVDEYLPSSNADKASSFKEDVGVRRVEPVLPHSLGKNVTGILDPNSYRKPFLEDEEAISMHDPSNRKFSSRRGIEVSDTCETHNTIKFRGFKLEPHIGKETFPRDNKNRKAPNHHEAVTSDQIKSRSLSQEKMVTGGCESTETTKKATPQNLVQKKPEFRSTGEQTKSDSIESLVSPDQKQQMITNTGQVRAGDGAKYRHFHPPPYVKPSKAPRDAVNSESKDAGIHGDCVTPQADAVDHIRPKLGSGRDGIRGQFDNTMKPPKASRHVAVSESKLAGLSKKGIGRHFDEIGHTRTKSGQLSRHAWSQFDQHLSEKQINERARANHNQGEACSDHDDIARLILPKPRSIRRRSTRSSSNDSSHNEGSGRSDEKRTVTRTSNRRRRHESRRIKTLVDTDIPKKDEEDKILDNLLIHYSSKPSSLDTLEDATKKSGEIPVTTSFPPRSVSLPREHSVPLQPTKVFTRAATFQLDRPAHHVHPKLPDYDDLAATFSAMKATF